MGIRKVFLIFSLLCLAVAMIFSQDMSEDSPQSDSQMQDTIIDSDSEDDSGPPDDIVPIYSTPIEGGEPSFRLSDTENNLLFFQRLRWEEAQYAVSYHVVLERKRDNLDSYMEVLRRNVNEPFLDISVPFGEYRYRVMSFNILGLVDSQSDWEYFVVLQALQPSIVDFSPGTFYLDRLSPRIIILYGENLLPDSEIYLVNLSPDADTGEPAIIYPVEKHCNELGENARLIFAEEDLVSGSYEIFVRNAGGLETRKGVFRIAVAKPFDINVSGGYTPMLTLFGQKEHFLDHVFIPLSFSIRGSFIPFKKSFGFIGFEIDSLWSYITSSQEDFNTRAQLVLVNANLLYQYFLVRRTLSINARAGVGFAGLFNYRFKYNTGKSSSPMSTAAFTYNLGASVEWLVYKQFFIEGGFDYIHITHPEIPLGFIRIGMFAGYQF